MMPVSNACVVVLNELVAVEPVSSVRGLLVVGVRILRPVTRAVKL